MSDSLAMDELVALLELAPTESWPKGFVPNVGVKRSSAGVRYVLPIADGEVQLGEVLTPNGLERLIAKREHLSTELSIIVYVAETAGTGLSLESVRMLAAIHASIDLDIYASDS